MANYQYHRILPQNAKDSYTEFDVVDFQMSFPMRSLLIGSVRLEGQVDVVADGNITLDKTTNIPAPQNKPANELDIRLNGEVGAHAFVETVTTRIGGQVVESLGDYARYVKMSAAAMASPDDMCNSSNVCELKAARSEITTQLLRGELLANDPGGGITGLRESPDFSIKPRIVLNGGRGAAAHSRTGDITVSFSLGRNYAALFGMDVASNIEYKLKDLRLTFNSIPDDGSSEPVPCRAKLNIKQSIQSSKANINVRVPAKCDSVSCSFNVQSQENTPKYDNQVLHQVPNLSTTQFIFNDSTNSLVSYQIRNNAELIDRAIDSFVDAEKNSLSTTRLANGDAFLLGLNFDEVIDLSMQKFSVELDSAVSNVVPLIIYMYFHSMQMI